MKKNPFGFLLSTPSSSGDDNVLGGGTLSTESFKANIIAREVTY